MSGGCEYHVGRTWSVERDPSKYTGLQMDGRRDGGSKGLYKSELIEE